MNKTLLIYPNYFYGDPLAKFIGSPRPSLDIIFFRCRTEWLLEAVETHNTFLICLHKDDIKEFKSVEPTIRTILTACRGRRKIIKFIDITEIVDHYEGIRKRN